ncbi:hypothetical protein [Clostridium sp. YIM B02506]|uniref:hypothetical protein n=1 Tax=Clostridium sp. YIM B02506 TaxID=2910680 RepID=UPI001EED788B|nr:hypothetical protein [Clostridium sp. YIM B02506]
MAYVTKNDEYVDLEEGFEECEVVDYQPKGIKVTKNKNVFNEGYLLLKLRDNIMVEQYMLLTQTKRFLFYQLLKATKEDFDIKEECKNFDFESIKGKKVVIKLEHNFDGVKTYTNVVNIYDIEDGRAIIEHVKQEELENDENNIYSEEF